MEDSYQSNSMGSVGLTDSDKAGETSAQTSNHFGIFISFGHLLVLQASQME